MVWTMRVESEQKNLFNNITLLYRLLLVLHEACNRKCFECSKINKNKLTLSLTSRVIIIIIVSADESLIKNYCHFQACEDFL